MTKAENSHIHTQIQHDFSIPHVNSPRKETLPERMFPILWPWKKKAKKKKVKRWEGLINYCQKSEFRVEIIPFRDGG